MVVEDEVEVEVGLGEEEEEDGDGAVGVGVGARQVPAQVPVHVPVQVAKHLGAVADEATRPLEHPIDGPMWVGIDSTTSDITTGTITMDIEVVAMEEVLMMGMVSIKSILCN